MNLIYGGGWTDWNQAFNSGLKLHAAGDLSYTNGMLYTTRGKDGIYWSSTQYASYDTAIGQLIIISNSGVSGSYYRKSSGYSLRCIRENCTSGPNSPFSGTHIPFQTGIRWIWTQVNGATGYKWNISNDPASATDMDTVTAITETGLTCGTTYTRYVWAYNTCGNSTPLILNQATSACSDYCGLPVTDSRDGKSYNTILIGTQCWMAQNLNIGVRINGNQYQLNNGTIEKYCYNNLESMCDVYGGLYQWNELMNYTTSSNTNPSGRQGICMTGWHVPSESEWCQMETLMDPTVNCNSTDVTGTDAGGKMKETGITHWITPNTGAINTFGLSILPGGQVYPTSAFSNRGQYGYFWPATESSANGAGFYLVLYNTSQIARYTNKSKAYGMSARCVKD